VTSADAKGAGAVDTVSGGMCAMVVALGCSLLYLGSHTQGVERSLCRTPSRRVGDRSISHILLSAGCGVLTKCLQ